MTKQQRIETTPNNDDAFQQALRLLTGRDHSERELAAKLRRRGFPAVDIEHTLQRCRDHGYLDDRRYALARARSLVAQGRAVGPLLEAELRRRGIEVELATEAAQKAAAEFPQETILEWIFDRRFGGFDFEKADSRNRKRVVDYCLRRGFSLEAVLQFIRKRGCQIET